MPNPGAFQGSRKEFLASKKMEFANSVSLGYTGEQLVTIQREYFKRYPIDLPHNEEPSPEHLAAVDDDAADPEIEEPDEKTMSPEEYQAAMKTIKERRVLIAKRKAQIKRWLIYQYMKDSDSDPRDQRAFSPYHTFLCNLRGTVSDKPCRKSAVNVWRKFHRERIERVSKLTSEREKVPRSQMASLRDRIARKMFADLSLEEQKDWHETSMQEHDLAVQEWEALRRRPISTTPKERQRAIQGLVRFIQPALNVIADVTGWKASLFAGGPEPAQEGMLNVISVHSGTTSGDIKTTFGQSERAAIKKDFIPVFGAFLQKCYTPEECRARALSGLEGFVPISEMELEGTQAIIHPLAPSPAPTTPSGAALPSVHAPPATAASSNNATPSVVDARLSVPQPPTQKTVPSPAATVISPSTTPAPPVTGTPVAGIPPTEGTDHLADDGVEDEDTPLPVVYRLSSEPPASPVHLPISPVRSRQASVAPSRPSSPTPGLALPQPEAGLEGLPSKATAVLVSSSGSPSIAAALVISSSALDQPSTLQAPAPATPSCTPTPAPAASASDQSPGPQVQTPPSAPSPTTSTPSAAPAARASSRPKRAKGPAKEIANPGDEIPATKENHRPRHEVKKTVKALCIEEEMSKKNAQGTKHPHAMVEVEDPAPSKTTPKRLRKASKKNGQRD